MLLLAPYVTSRYDNGLALLSNITYGKLLKESMGVQYINTGSDNKLLMLLYALDSFDTSGITLNVLSEKQVMAILDNIAAAGQDPLSTLVSSPLPGKCTAAALPPVSNPLRISVQPVGSTLNVGDTLSLAVTAVGGSGNYTYQWRIGTTPITGATSAAYSKANAQTGDSGSYNVVVSDGLTSVTSTSVQITVNASAGSTRVYFGSGTVPILESAITATSTHIDIVPNANMVIDFSAFTNFDYLWFSPIAAEPNKTQVNDTHFVDAIGAPGGANTWVKGSALVGTRPIYYTQTQVIAPDPLTFS